MEPGSLNNPEGNEVMRKIKEELLDPSAEGLGLAHAMGLSENELKATYMKASQLLAQNEVARATKLFALLTVLQHNDARHWRGLGVCAQRFEQWAIADFFYGKALNRNPEDVVSLVFRGEARINLGRSILAKEDLDRAIEIGASSKDRDAQTYAKRAKNVLQMVAAGETGGGFDR